MCPLLMMHKTCSINYGHLADLQKTLPTTDLNKKKTFHLIKYLLATFIFFLSFRSVLVYLLKMEKKECYSVCDSNWNIRQGSIAGTLGIYISNRRDVSISLLHQTVDKRYELFRIDLRTNDLIHVAGNYFSTGMLPLTSQITIPYARP